MRRPVAGALALVTVTLLAGPACAEDLVVLRDGRPVRVERAEQLPDRVRIESPPGRIMELPRREVLAVFPVPNLALDARPHAARYGDITRRVTEQVRRDLERGWSLPPSSGR